jgi:hypothetical protein
MLAASNGSLLHIDASVGTGQTISINASTLEFGVKGNYSNPSMQFLGKIVGENASSTILLGGSYGVSESLRALSTAGAGLADLQVFDQRHVMLADMQFVGHFQAADFTLTPHVGSTGAASDAWTALTFVNHPNTIFAVHS